MYVVGLVACGGSRTTNAVGDDAGPVDSGIDGPIVPESTHYGYVVSKASVPTSNQQATDYGLDLGTARSGTPDGTVDNRLGEVLGVFAGMGFDIQGTVDTAVAQGSIILLVDFQTKDFTSASAAGFGVKFGANPVPAACNGATDTTCGHHLTGSASFSIAADSPTDAPVAGTIVDGTFNGGPGDLSLQLALGTTQPSTLRLRNARARASAISDAGMTANIGGALSVTDLNTQVIPAIGALITGILDRDCGTARMPPTCGCAAGSTSVTLLNLFDGDIAGTVKDCNISTEEIAGNPIIKSLFSPDICGTTTCTAPDALSLGIQVQTVKATFPL
jgi:hypothetical protein